MKFQMECAMSPQTAAIYLVQDKDGALLIADDVGNTVWRFTAATHG